MMQVIVQAAVRHNPIKIFSLLAGISWILAILLIVGGLLSDAGGLLASGLFGVFCSILIFGQGLIAESSRVRR